MANWTLTNAEPDWNSEVFVWKNGDKWIKYEDFYKFLVGMDEGDTPPKVDLSNPDGYRADQWSFEEMEWHKGNAQEHSDNMTDEEVEEFTDLMDEEGYSWWDDADIMGFTLADQYIVLEGPLILTNADTGEKWGPNGKITPEVKDTDADLNEQTLERIKKLSGLH